MSPWTGVCKKCGGILVPDLQDPNRMRCSKCGIQYFPEWSKEETHAGVL